ncbi:copper chaperone [Seinonella peptonophila]|uniref:Copper chaperone n=1 Tax=Seinonella peptonophila TaxID=112248 RepID=A0A1M5BLJ8_9BACL|nr:cation transporter [Seinonella peptonophila]SHF43421.1 copper chaperone [Seinonella peptonophila]
MKKILKVEGMSCAHCVSSIEGALKEIDVKANVDLATHQVEIDYQEGKPSIEAIKETIEDLGYDVVSNS